MSAWRTSSPFAMPPRTMSIPLDKLHLDKLPMEREVFTAAAMSTSMIMVKISDGRRKGAIFCSGVLVAGEGDLPRVLTKRPCLIKHDDDETPDLIRDTCANTVVYFDKHVIPRGKGIVPKLERTCKRGSLRTSFEGGLAVFTLSEVLPSGYPGIEIWDEDELPLGRHAFMVHYPSHPQTARWIKMVRVEGGSGNKVPPKLINTRACMVGGRVQPRVINRPDARDSAHELRYSVFHTCMLSGGGTECRSDRHGDREALGSEFRHAAGLGGVNT